MPSSGTITFHGIYHTEIFWSSSYKSNCFVSTQNADGSSSSYFISVIVS